MQCHADLERASHRPPHLPAPWLDVAPRRRRARRCPGPPRPHSDSSPDIVLAASHGRRSHRQLQTPRQCRPRRSGPFDREGTIIITADSQFGSMLYDASGQAIYLFDAERGTRPECYGECADAWPPVLTTGEAPGQRERAVRPPRHDPPKRRRNTGHLRRPPAVLLRTRRQVPSPLPRHRGVRRHLVGRPARRQTPRHTSVVLAELLDPSRPNL